MTVFLFPEIQSVQAVRQSAVREESIVYTIGVAANRGKDEAFSRWKHTARYLSREVGGASFMIIPLDFAEIFSSAERGELDFLILNPAIFVKLQEQFDYQAVATLKREIGSKGVFSVLGGVLFTRAERQDINQLEDLRGQTFLAVDERSFGGWHVIWREMGDQGFDPHADLAKLDFAGQQDAVVHAVLAGKYDAGAVRTGILEELAYEGKISLDHVKVFNTVHSGIEDEKVHWRFPLEHSTRLYPEWPFARAGHIPLSLAERVADALLEIEPDNIAAVSGRYNGWTLPVSYQSVRDCLKILGIAPYEGYGQFGLADVIEKYRPWIIAVIVLFVLLGIAGVLVLLVYRRLRWANMGLQKTTGELEMILDSMPVVTFYKDTNNTLVQVNKYFADMVGRPLKELVGRSCYDIFPEDAESYAEHDRRVFQSGKPALGVVERIIKPDGEIRWLQSDRFPDFDASGRIRGLTGFSVDITKRLQAQQIVEQQAGFLTTLLESIPLPIFYKDRELKYTGCNEAFCGFLGKDREEIIGHGVFEMAPEAIAHKYHEKDLEVIREGRRQIYEFKVPNSAGEYRDVVFHKAPIRDDAGRVSGLIGAVIDVTDQRVFAHELQRQRELLETVLNNVPHFIFWKDRDLRFLGCNQNFAAVFGYDRPDDLIGKTDYDLHVKKEEADFYRKIDQQVMERGEPILNLEEPQTHDDGRETILLTSKVPLRDNSGSIIGLLGMFADITEQKKAQADLERLYNEVKEKNKQLVTMQDQLVQSDKMAAVGQLSAGVAHEIKNPLAVILLAVQILELAQDRIAEDLRNKVTMIREAVEKADHVVTDLLDYSRKVNLEQNEDVELSAVISSALELIKNKSKFGNVKMTLDIADDARDASVKGSRVLLEQVLINLLNNAVDAVEDTPDAVIIVHLKTAPDDGQYIIKISDNGCGMDKETRASIFNPFFTTKDPGKGTGLGLSTVFMIVERHGGIIDVESTPGKGSTFIIKLTMEERGTHGAETDSSDH